MKLIVLEDHPIIIRVFLTAFLLGVGCSTVAGNRTAHAQMSQTMAGSDNAEIWVLPGEGHATDLFEHNPDLHLRLQGWIDQQLAQ